jgi:phage terminase large subunit-like protein
MEAIRSLGTRYALQSVAYDPRLFEIPARMLADEGVQMVEVPQSPERMIPICGRLWEAIVGGRLAHDGDPILTDHVIGAARRDSSRGWSLSKSRSGRHIDGCIALALALSCCTNLKLFGV